MSATTPMNKQTATSLPQDAWQTPAVDVSEMSEAPTQSEQGDEFDDKFETRCQQTLYGIDSTLNKFTDSPKRAKFLAKILGWKKLDYRDEYELTIDQLEWAEGQPEPDIPAYVNKEEKEEQIRIYSSPYVFLSNWYTPMEFGEFCGNLGKEEFANGYDGEHVYTFYQYENEWGQMETAFLVGIYLP